jgi:hypothetical protein
MRKIVKPKMLFIALLVAGIAGCLDKINLDIPKGTEATIVIQGKLLKGNPSVISVNIRRLFDFTSASRDQVAVREVLLIDEEGRSVELESPSLGYYELEIPENASWFSIETGQSYQLRVATLDGRTYESMMEPLLATPEPAGLRAEIIQKQVERKPEEFIDKDFVRFFITAPLSTSEGGQKVRLRWEMTKTYRITDSPGVGEGEPKTCYVMESADIQHVDIFDGTAARENTLTDYVLFDEPIGSLFAEGYYLTAYQEALSEEAFRYWDNIDDLIERTNSILEPPAGKIRGNFRNVNEPDDEAFGIFYAVEQKVVRLFISPEFAGNPTKLCPPNVPPPPGGGCPLPPCCNCLDAGDFSTLIKPPYWVE